jgi:tetratricopeptide (TPR) repeat protein
MKKQIVSRTGSLVAALILIAAAGCTQPKETTAIGSATGGAIGAGLGAIVGNQTGSTGGGIAIGAVAGAATGALIGNALQAQQETAQSQDEALERQERMISAQRQELNELRTINPDTTSAAPARSSHRSLQHQSLSPEAQRKLAQLERRGPNPRGSHSMVAYEPPPLKRNSEPLARYNAESNSAAPRAKAPAAQAKPQQAAALSISKSEAAKPKAAELAGDEPSNPASIGEADILDEGAAEAQASASSLAEDTQANSSACSEAAGEAQAAQSATESSQKLYHLRRAQRLCPTNSAFYTDLGSLYLSMGRVQDARNSFNDALKIDPNLQAARTGLEEVKAAGPDKF